MREQLHDGLSLFGQFGSRKYLFREVGRSCEVRFGAELPLSPSGRELWRERMTVTSI
jgi:hypothetical protein